ncbi:unnamed protein product [Aphanomyces euteiches]
MAVPQPKRLCASTDTSKPLKIVDPIKAIDRVMEVRSSWRPIDPNSPKVPLQHRFDNLSVRAPPVETSPESDIARAKSSASEISLDLGHTEGEDNSSRCNSSDSTG